MSNNADIGASIDALNPSITDPKRCNKPTVPELLKPNCSAFQETQNVDTSLLDPVVVKDNYIRWVLDRKGILHSNSKISLQFNHTAGDPASDRAFFPFQTGVKSFIQKCVLRSGTTILDSTDRFNVFSAYKNTLKSNEENVRKERIKSGVVGAYKQTRVPTMDVNGVADGTEAKSDMTVDVGKEFSLAFTAGTGTSTRTDAKCPVTLPGNQNLYNSSEFVIDLHEMFSSLKHTQIPLFMIDEPVIIELFLENLSQNRICKPNGQATTPVFVLDQTSPSLIADYIYYDIDTMNAFQENNKNLELPFLENKLITTTVNYANSPNYVRNLGGASKAISKVTIAHTVLTGDLGESLYNMFLSDVPGVKGNGLDYNLRINDRFIYPVSINNPSEQYVQTLNAESLPMNICARDYLDGLGVAFSDNLLLEAYQQPLSVSGQKRYMAIRNITGERINNRGVELHINAVGANSLPLQQLVWLEINKRLILSNGRWTEIYN